MVEKKHKVSIMIQAQNRSQQAFGAVRRSLSGLKGAFGSAQDTMQKMMGGLQEMRAGAAIIQNLTGPALTFEAAMKRAQVTAGASEAEFLAMGEAVKRLASEQKIYSELDTANALKALTEAGFNAQQSIDSLEQSLNLATVANVDTTRAANMLKEALVSYNLSASDASRVSDVLSQTFLETGTSIQDQVSAITFLGQTFAALNIPIEESSALIGVLGDLGIKGTRAMSSFASALGDMIDPGTELNKMFSEANVRVDEFALGTVSLQEFINDLGVAFDSGRITAQQLATILEGRTANAFLGLAQNAQYVDDTIKATKDSMGATEQAAQDLTDTSAAAAQELQKEFEDLKMQMGTALIPAMMPMLDLMKNLIDLYEQMPGPLRELIPVLILTAASVMILHGAMLVLSTNPILLVIIAIVAAVYLGIRAWQLYGGEVEDLMKPFNKLVNLLERAWELIKKIGDSAFGKIAQGLGFQGIGGFSGVSMHPISGPTTIPHTGQYILQKGEVVSPGMGPANTNKGLGEKVELHLHIGSIRNDRDIRLVEQGVDSLYRRRMIAKGANR
jgi:TP901 family phage tail tape measure protein